MHWPYIVFHSHLPTLHHAAGWAIGPIILINPDYRGCQSILVHERVHVAQWWRYMLKLSPVLIPVGWVWYQTGLTFIVVPLLGIITFHMVRKFLMGMILEAEAFRAQLAYLNYDEAVAREMAEAIANGYGFGVEFERAYECLVQGTPLEGVEPRAADLTSQTPQVSITAPETLLPDCVTLGSFRG
jgi:hypothetical protein